MPPRVVPKPTTWSCHNKAKREANRSLIWLCALFRGGTLEEKMKGWQKISYMTVAATTHPCCKRIPRGTNNTKMGPSESPLE
jgi:hypothetical protein